MNNTGVTQTSEAWLLECGAVRVLLSVINMQHVVEATQMFHMPMMPAHCNTVLVWQQHVMPIINIAGWLHEPVSTCPYSCIIGWQDIERGTEYGVLAASAFPQRIKVHDANCVTPSTELAQRWRQCALCFVQLGNEIVPVIDPARLFGASQFKLDADSRSLGMIA